MRRFDCCGSVSPTVAAVRAGFKKFKINMVVIGGVNDDEVKDFARLTMQQPWTVRFIESMPLAGPST